MNAVSVFLLVLCLSQVAVSHAWDCNEAPRLHSVKQIDAGMGQVVAVTKYGRPYQLSGKYWYSLGLSTLQHVTVGPAGTWGSDTKHKVQKLVAGNWKQVNGESLYQVDAGGYGQVVGVAATTSYSCCVKNYQACGFYGSGSVSWILLAKRAKYISCGKKYGCWSVNAINQTYVTTTIVPSTCRHSGWTYVQGPPMTMIEVSTDGQVFGVGTNGKVYQRTGITKLNKVGKSWKHIPMCMPISHVTYDLRHLWVVTKSGLILKCTH